MRLLCCCADGVAQNDPRLTVGTNAVAARVRGAVSLSESRILGCHHRCKDDEHGETMKAILMLLLGFSESGDCHADEQCWQSS
eukprot:1294626-Rhodomonas_salina.2